MRDLGMRIQLNHPNGESCYNPVKSYNDDFTVIDLNGVHSVAVNYCNCHLAQPRMIQLLLSRLYPATVIDPKTAATFQVLEHFHLCTLVSKISAFDFYTTLSHRTDNTGTKEVPVSSPALLWHTKANPNSALLPLLSSDGVTMVTPQAIEASRPWTSSIGEEWYTEWRMCCPLPSVSSTGEESAIRLDGSASEAMVRTAFPFLLRSCLTCDADGCILCFSGSMPISV